MEPPQACPECGASWQTGSVCQDHFHQMLFWENEYPGYGEVHHLAVLSYHLQHPSLYSPETLQHGKQLLLDFLERGIPPAEVRQRDRDKVDSGKRKHKVTGTPDHHGAYDPPVRWTMTAGDVTAGGAGQYCDSVRAWARSILADLRASGNIL